MGRPPKFDKRQIAAAAMEIIAESGPRAATMAAIANRLGAPTGSIYYRYDSREVLLADLWLELVEGYQRGLVTVLGGGDTVAVGVAAARYTPGWVRANFVEARLLLLHRREDFVAGPWPEEVVHRASGLNDSLALALKDYTRRCFGRVSEANLTRVRFAILDVPYGATKRFVESGRVPPRQVDTLVERACVAVLGEERDG